MPSLFRLMLLISLPLFLLDFVSKEWTVRSFPAPSTEFTPPLTVIPGFFDLTRVHNTGVAFGMGNGGAYANYIFGTISLTALAALGWMYRKGGFPTRIGQLAVGLLIAGVLGNLLDRFLRGYVVDFLSFHYRDAWSFAVFNIADSCICVAAGCLFLSAFQNQAPAATTGKSSAPLT